MVMLSIMAIVLIIVYIVNNAEYKKTEYYKHTGTGFLSMRLNKGKYGEFLTYKKLISGIDDNKKFLFNCYIPKENGETTEIDLIMIHKTGIYVFESKNYSGWIFGSETNYQWTQTLPNGRGRSQKNHFLNPIIQNKGHMKWLASYINKDIPMYSFIVFSERCELKSITLTSGNHYVSKRNALLSKVKENIAKCKEVLTDEEIQSLFDKLYDLTQVSDEVKRTHIEQIKEHTSQNGELTHSDNAAESTETVEEEQVIQDETISQPEEMKSADDGKDLICPVCGAKLVLRTAKKGNNAGNQFLGCSAFPKCRYTRNT